MKKKAQTEDTNVSFLDVICCGFGAIVLLLMITKIADPTALEKSDLINEGQIAAMQDQLFKIRGETRIFNRDMTAKQEQISIQEERLAILRSKLQETEARYQALLKSAANSSESIGDLQETKERLDEDLRKLLAKQPSPNDLIAGIPLDSEYIIFVIDTSPSMKRYAWSRVIEEVKNALEIYPALKGIQVISDGGKYMYPGFRRTWIPDTPGRRDAIIEKLYTWTEQSRSNPIPGVREAVAGFYEPGKKISVYVLGDDLQSNASIQEVIDAIDRINRQGGTEPLVRIHGIGFPVIHKEGGPSFQPGAARFANFMMTVTQRNGGAFIALNDYEAQLTRRPGL